MTSRFVEETSGAASQCSALQKNSAMMAMQTSFSLPLNTAHEAATRCGAPRQCMHLPQSLISFCHFVIYQQSLRANPDISLPQHTSRSHSICMHVRMQQHTMQDSSQSFSPSCNMLTGALPVPSGNHGGVMAPLYHQYILAAAP